MRLLCCLALTVAALAGALTLIAPESAAAVTWCGTESSADQPDTLGGNLVHVVYALPSDGPDRFAERASAIATDLAFGGDWWRSQDPIREPRFDFMSVPGCTTRFGQLDITTVRVADPAAVFADPAGRHLRLLTGVAPTLDDRDKKYVIYFESPVNLEGDICGTAFRAPTSGGVEGSGVVWIAANLYGFPGCGVLGSGGYFAATAVHELIHALGALAPSGPPHACPNDDGHPCDDPNDILSPFGSSDSLFSYVLDSGRDDYYGHSATWWDVQDSAWLAHLDAPARRVAVATVGGGADSSVASRPPGIACPARCALDFESDMPISLTAAPGEGFDFLAWNGDCSGEGETCSVALGRPASVTARFAPIRWKVAVRVTGRGRITSRPRGIVACPGRCQGTIAFGSSARLVASPSPGSRFVRWSGDCSGRRACVVKGNATVNALFRR
jgi:List-Bact-rpt repeat protein